MDGHEQAMSGTALSTPDGQDAVAYLVIQPSGDTRLAGTVGGFPPGAQGRRQAESFAEDSGGLLCTVAVLADFRPPGGGAG